MDSEMLEQTKIKRFNFLKALYDESSDRLFPARQFARKLALSDDESRNVVNFLKGEGFLKTHLESGSLVSITHARKKEIERAMSEPNTASKHFPSINVMIVHIRNGSQVSQGSTNTTQTQNITENHGEKLSEFIKLFEQKISEIQFQSNDDRREAVAEVSTIKAQLDSPKPKWEIIKSSGSTVKGILEKAAGSILASQLLEYLKDFL
jgi:hypothetical protein